MDSKVVTREIKREIWPLLRQQGFDKFVGRTGWRHSPTKIDVVNFQSFNSYLAERVGCTTFSFSLNLGSFLTFVPSSLDQVTMTDGVLLPKEFECHFRRRLHKTIAQPELKRADTWFIGSEGEYLAESIADAVSQIKLHGLQWFDRFDDEAEVMRTLQNDDEGETWGIGAKDSPQRHILLGCAELSQNNRASGVRHLKIALQKLSNTAFPMSLESRLRKQIAELDSD